MTRKHGVVDSAAGLVPFGHLGWGYRTKSEFLSRAAEYITDGLDHNQWIQYVGPGDREQLRADLDTMPGDTSAVTVTPATEFYGVDDLTDVVTPEVALDLRAATLDEALASGYSGVRVVADPSAVTATPEQRESFARLEFLIDQKMADAPITALCAYFLDGRAGGPGELLCLHPLVGPESPAFRVYAEPDTAFAIDGEIDAAGNPTFATTLQRIWPLTGDGDVVIDAGGVEFISHRELAILDHLAGRDRRQVVLRDCPPLLTRLLDLIDLSNIRRE